MACPTLNALPSRPATRSPNVTELSAQRTGNGGHPAGASQSPTTSHGVGTHGPPQRACAESPAAATHASVIAAAPKGTATRVTTSQRLVANASRSIESVTGTATATTAANATNEPFPTMRKDANSTGWLCVAVASGVSSTE